MSGNWGTVDPETTSTWSLSHVFIRDAPKPGTSHGYKCVKVNHHFWRVFPTINGSWPVSFDPRPTNTNTTNGS